ncbi:MAG: HAMP domain-containing protein, partial [Anaerotignaceae bacterium]
MKKTIFKTQMFIYMGILLISFGIFGVAISYYYTQLNMKEQERTLILQGERFKESMSSLYYTGAMDVARMGFEIQIMESYMDASVFFMNSNGKISLVSKSLNENWIGETITDEAVSIVLGGNVATVIGKVGGMFNETVLTVGYPIIIGNQTLGGVFMCKSLLTVEKEANDTIKIIFSAMLPVVIIGVTLIYFSTRRISLPLQNMNAVAKVIADGNFENRIEVDSEDEVGQLAQSFNYMAENLEKIENNRRKFTANISHD